MVQGGLLKKPFEFGCLLELCFFLEFVGEGMRFFWGGRDVFFGGLFLKFPGPSVLQPGFGMWLEE